ncbi:MAG: hypothetical protein NC898_02040 [Candidatus Omnitrophica bacterium]|nr:hypothetical protein [Candidatus Omnitrophota bacterium]MCM8793233.1 hypothetical protein [Candidatus Omnitrophota bacterium]
MEQRLLSRVTRKFNSRRAPECKAKVVFQRDGVLCIEFSGTKASFACCFDENFVDYQYYLKDITGKDFSLQKIERKRAEKFRVFYEEVRKDG